MNRAVLVAEQLYTATVDPGDMAADGNSVNGTVTATAVALPTDGKCFVQVTPMPGVAVTAGCVITAHVSAQNTIAWQAINKTGAGYNIASSTWGFLVRVWKKV